MKKKLPLFLVSIILLLILQSFSFEFQTPLPPIVSHQSGFYDHEFSLTLIPSKINETIHFTLDGSTPTINSPIYSEPIRIRDRSNDPDDLSMISMVTTISYRYDRPQGVVNKVTIIRVRSFNNITKAGSTVINHTYLVNKEMEDRYSLPIISLIVDPSDFFDQEIGIYVTGKGPQEVAQAGDDYYFWPANYHNRGEEWERSIYFEYYDQDGILQNSQNAGVRIHGAASKSYSQKSLRLYADSNDVTSDKFNFHFFPNLFNVTGQSILDKFDTLILRNAGTDWPSAFMRDMLVQRLVNHTSLDTQATSPVIVFLNGEYWGVYFLYERYDEFYFKNHYDINPKDVIILEDVGKLNVGVNEDLESYRAMLDFVRENDVNDSLVYSKINDQIDFINFIDYQIAEIFVANTDWPENNVKFWRSRTENNEPNSPYGTDGKWRWMVFDVDHGFDNLDFNSIEWATRNENATILLASLLENNEFKQLFLSRFADHINTTFQTERVIDEIDRIESILEPEMEEQISRWISQGGSVENWKGNVNHLRVFARERPSIVVNDLIEYFYLDGSLELNILTNSEGGFVRVNSIDVLPSTPGINDASSFQGIYFQDIPITIQAIPLEGYEFSHWEGSIHNNDTNPNIVITSDKDISLIAVFVSNNQVNP